MRFDGGNALNGSDEDEFRCEEAASVLVWPVIGACGCEDTPCSIGVGEDDFMDGQWL